MKFSYHWLATLVDLKDFSAHDIANKLNDAGIEVEAVAPLVQATKITTGYVQSQEKIPGSDHLSKVIVDTGHHGMRTIVCGAPNIRAGQKVLVALPGAVLPGITIQSSLIKGVPSEGMVCALDELGVDKKYLLPAQVEGIEILPPDTVVGDDAILEKMGLKDTIITLKLLANRPDLWSLQGIAYEVAALTNRPLTLPKVEKKKALKPSTFKLDIQSEKTKQFSIKVMRGIVQTVTPDWLKQRLIASGIRPLSFLVDIGNYIMLLTGQPLHMYDLDKLPHPSLTLVDHGPQSFVALDEKTYSLLAGDITILSQEQVMCLAGVMGAQVCAVDATTKNIAIEAAAFDQTSIRKTSMRLGLISDASIRFAKGIDLSRYEDVLTLTANLIESLTKVAEEEITVTVNRLPQTTPSIRFQPLEINRLLGTDYDAVTIMETLQRLAIQVEQDGPHLIATPPAHRGDLLTPADLAEEMMRLKGFADIKLSAMPAPVQAGGYDERQEKLRSIKQLMLAQGLDAVLTYTLVEKPWLKAFQLLPSKSHFVLKNPLSDERQHVRNHLLASLIQVVQYNMARQITEGKIFEISSLFSPEGQGQELAFVLFGQIPQRDGLLAQPQTFYHGKGLVEGLLTLLNLEPSRYQWKLYDQQPNVMHPGRSAGLYLQNQLVGVVGELSPIALTQFDLGKFPVVVAQIDLQAILALKTSQTKLKAIPRFPVVFRDLALVLPKAMSYQQVVKTIKKSGKKLVEDVTLFDVYEGANLPAGQISLAVRVQLRDETKTLQEEEILQAMTAIKAALISECQASLRS